MKEAASHNMEIVTDASSLLSKGLKKSLKNYEKDAKRFVRSFTNFLDFEDLLKSIHKVSHPEEYHRSTSIVHKPIDWSKYPPSAFRTYSDDFSTTIEEEIEENGNKHSELDDIEDDEASENSKTIDEAALTSDESKRQIHRRKSGESPNTCWFNRRFSALSNSHLKHKENVAIVDETSMVKQQLRIRRRTHPSNPAYIEPWQTQSISSKVTPSRRKSFGGNQLKTRRDFRCPSPPCMGRKKRLPSLKPGQKNECLN